jgi:hypothetical protein
MDGMGNVVAASVFDLIMFADQEIMEFALYVIE